MSKRKPKTQQQPATELRTPEQIRYMEWLCLPKAIRQPKTELQFARTVNVDRVTLWRWRQLPGFLDDVTRNAKLMLRSDVPDIIAALAATAKKGDVPAIKLALEISGDYQPSMKVQDWRTELIALLKAGEITPEQVEEELGSSLAGELFKSIGLSIADA